jgi:hypothetical protein
LFNLSYVTASLGSVTETLNYNKYCAYANEFQVTIEDPDVGKLRTIALEAIGLIRGHNFGWNAFWYSNPMFMFKVNVRLNRGEIYPPYVGTVRTVLGWRVASGIWLTTEEMSTEKTSVRDSRKVPVDTIQCGNMAGLWVARASCRSRSPCSRGAGSMYSVDICRAALCHSPSPCTRL